jgi:SAM-dependent MidA family methyltransferase
MGVEGDFITAPLVSQMFGELIGLWAVEVWTRMGSPAHFRLIEMGPGDGTLMGDMLRAARLAPAFLAAANLWLVEASAPLVERQRAALAEAPLKPQWAQNLEGVPGDAPMILVANELLDCLSARQFIRAERGWAERMVGIDAEGAIAFGLGAAPDALIPDSLKTALVGAVAEVSTAQANLGRTVGERIARDGGAALFIDYGRAQPETGDTLQALSRHKKVDPLATAGEADLTVHADFPAFAAAARSSGAEATPTITQAAFLTALGIEARAEALIHARPDRAETVARQMDRLISPAEMGKLFKVVAIHSPGLAVAGF